MSMIGKTLAHYEITSQLGKGGMGEVYQAKDRKLGRDVAIKVLPGEFAKDADRVARFQREAKLLASLNHPNIAAIHGLEESGGINFLVLELVEGETLADQIKRGPIPVEESLKLAHQIAEALEAAHEKGVIHRDLKPANIKVTPDGKVKVLDFGLAKAFTGEQTDPNPSNSPTLTRSPTLSDMATQQGVILGTAAYMSPEQARGKAVDKRTDIWAFGCVLYEMLTGQATFQGEDVTEILASVVKGGANLDLLPANLHFRVREVITRCLQKDLKRRYHDIADARYEIEQVLADPSGVLAQPITTEAPPRKLRSILPWATAALILGLIIAGVAVWKLKPIPPPEPRQVVTTSIKLQPGFKRPTRPAVAISNNGRFIIYSSETDDKSGPPAIPQLYLRKMDQSDPKPIAGTEGGSVPFLSPDDRWVGFWVDGKLKKIPVEGGVATTLCNVSSMFGASWAPDNSIIFAGASGVSGLSFSGLSGLSRISADGGPLEALTMPDVKKEESGHLLPSYLPNGDAVLFTIMRFEVDTRPRLALLRMDTRKYQILFEDAADGRYVSTGHLLFMRQGMLMAVRFDPARMEAVGQPVALVKNVIQTLGVNSSAPSGQFGISVTGSLIYAAGDFEPDAKRSLVWVDHRGIEQPVTTMQYPFQFPRLSPDGQKIAYIAYGRERQVWVYDLSKGTNSRLTSEGRATFPIWTPDGQRLLFMWHRALAGNLYRQSHDGSSPMERLTNSPFFQQPGSWSADGKTVAIVENHPETGSDIYLFDVDSKIVKPFLNSQFHEAYPDFSPDGRWLAYSSDESKQREVYVRPFPGSDRKYQISNEGGLQPLWAKDGKQLFYRLQDQVWVVDVNTTDRGFATSKPRLLFEKPGYAGSYPVRSWDLSHDGKRFLMVKVEQNKSTSITELTFIQNWFEELKRLVPTGKK